MSGAAYYNEFDPKAAAWLRELIKAGHLPQGDVDERSIADVQAGDLAGYGACHFFAGIGGWPYALQLAGWPEDREVWTGSCPCQPFSAAGRREGASDARHLWPAFNKLIEKCRPATVFGEQVASKDGRIWLAGIRADLEGLGYAVGAADLCAAGIGAPHIRQRLWWVADGQREGLEGRPLAPTRKELPPAKRSGDAGGLADAEHPERRPQYGPIQNERDGQDLGRPQAHRESGARGEVRGLEHTAKHGRKQRRAESGGRGAAARRQPWDSFDTLPCIDGKARRIEPGSFPLAHGIPSRVGLLRGYGNAIVPQVAAEFVGAFLECGK